jgi:hypothetical protein
MTTEYIEKFWVDATADHAVRVMNGETVEARFRDSVIHLWCGERKLTGVRAVDSPDFSLRWLNRDSSWRYCQVYEPESWWLERPDPGPGYRLLGKFPDEAKLRTDEYWSVTSEVWVPVVFGGSNQSEQVWYRRKIEQPKPKFAVGQLVRVVGPKGSDAKQWPEEKKRHLGKESAVSNRENRDAGWFYKLGCSATWAFREDQLEAVEPEPKHYVLRVGDTISTPSGRQAIVTELGIEVS